MALDLKNITIDSAADALASGEVTSVELCRACLERIGSVDGKVRAFLGVDNDKILANAMESDKRRKDGKALGGYDGIPVALKDNISAEGERCSCASKILDGFVSPYDSTVAARLKKAGFIPAGRANMDEFAMGSSCENSAFFKTANPWDLNRVPGGSSGGSAAAVASSQVPGALGSDTGGSIRQPAAFCGVVGMKPTYGRVSRYGLVAFASSLDQIGPFSKTVLDSAILLETVGGHDKMDATSLPGDFTGLADKVRSASGGLKGVRVGLPVEYLKCEGIDSAVSKVLDETIGVLKGLGAEMVDISLPHTKYAVSTYYIIATAEASANLARFDGVRYGKRASDAKDLLDMYYKTRGEGFGGEVKRRIILGTYVLSSGYYDAYYLKAQKVRTLIRKDFDDAFGNCDIILTPTTPTTAFKFGEKSDPLQMYLADIFTIALNLSGNCGLSVPAGMDEAAGLPVGAQFMAPAMEEERLLTFSRIFEQNRRIKKFSPSI